MRSWASSSTARAPWRWPTAFALLLSACTYFSPDGSDGSLDTTLAGVPPAGGEVAATDAHSPVLTFVGEAAPLQQAQLDDPRFGGLVSVTMEAEYHSASDKRCRRFRIRAATTPPEGRSHFACNSNGRWVLIDLQPY